MSTKVITNLDFNGNEFQNAVLHPLATAPSNPKPWQIYTNSTDGLIYQNHGSAASPNWVAIGAVLSVNGKTGTVVLAASDIGLGNVDNTSDATKKANFTGSIADGNTGFVTGDAAYDALAGKQAKINASGLLKGNGSGGVSAATAGTDYLAPAAKGAANGLAELDANGKVPSSQLPSYVDDIIDGYLYNGKFYVESAHTTEITGEAGKIYVDLGTEKTYRWSGSAYVEISASLALGETSSTAYAGDKGKEAHDTAAAALPKAGGTMSGAIAMGNNKITGLAAGTNDGDAVNKAQLDAAKPKTATGTIGTSATSASVNYSGTLLGAYAKQGNNFVLLDISATSSAVTFSCSAAPSSAITCVVVYL